VKQIQASQLPSDLTHIVPRESFTPARREESSTLVMFVMGGIGRDLVADPEGLGQLDLVVLED
jgi:hypothetical protein